MAKIDVNSPEERRYAKDVADWCARSLAEAKETGAFDTRCFVQNADLIIAALREYAEHHPFGDHRPTIAELEAILREPDTPVRVNPDGSVSTLARA